LSKNSDSSSLSEEDSPAEDAPTEQSQVSPAQYQNVDDLTNQIEEEQNDKENKSGKNMSLAEIERANNKSNDIEAANNKNKNESGINMPLAEIKAANDKSNDFEAVNDKNKNESSDVLDTPDPTKEHPQKRLYKPKVSSVQKQTNFGKRKRTITTTDDKSKSKASNHDESDSNFVCTRKSPLKIRHVVIKDDNNNSFVKVDARISGMALFDIDKEE
jgi:hypothetical protein